MPSSPLTEYSSINIDIVAAMAESPPIREQESTPPARHAVQMQEGMGQAVRALPDFCERQCTGCVDNGEARAVPSDGAVNERRNAEQWASLLPHHGIMFHNIQ